MPVYIFILFLIKNHKIGQNYSYKILMESEFYMEIKRGDIFYADLSPVIGSEQGGVRPVLIVQNDIGNKYSPTVIAAAITSQETKNTLPTHINLTSSGSGLAKNSVVLLEQIRTLDKKRLKEKRGNAGEQAMNKVNHALSVSFGLPVNNGSTY